MGILKSEVGRGRRKAEVGSGKAEGGKWEGGSGREWRGGKRQPGAEGGGFSGENQTWRPPNSTW